MNIQQFRVVVGSKLVKQYKPDNGLQNIFMADDILVQTNGKVKTVGKEGKIESISFGRSNDRFVQLQWSERRGMEMRTDRYGQMDIYYQRVGEGAVFGTDLSLLPFHRSKVEYDPIGVAHTLSIYGFRPAKRQTLYKGVSRLGVGETVLWNDSQLSFHQTPLSIMPTQEYGEKELEIYSENLLAAVAERSSPHGNVVYLSSGWDSTALLACLIKLYGPKKVRGVIGRLNFSKRSGVNNPFEIERAQKFADYFKIPLEVVDSDWSSIGPDLLERWRPFIRSHMISGLSFYNFANISEHVAKTTNGGEVIFCGEISDGAHNLGFSQFVTLFHTVFAFREYSDKMASYLFGPTFYALLQSGKYKEDVVYNLLKQKFPNAIFDEANSDPVGAARQLFSSFFLRNTRIPLWSLQNCRLLSEWGREQYSREMEEIYLNPAASAVTPETLYSWFLNLYNSFHWQGGTVSVLALTADACGLDLKLPFWDSRIMEFLAAMPESWGRGLDLKPTKYPLKWMLENKVDYPFHLQTGPHSYLYDVNPNFNHAGEFIYASQFASIIKKSVSDGQYKAILSPEVFDFGYFDQMVRHYLEGEETVPERTDLSALSFLALTSWYGS